MFVQEGFRDKNKGGGSIGERGGIGGGDRSGTISDESWLYGSYLVGVKGRLRFFVKGNDVFAGTCSDRYRSDFRGEEAAFGSMLGFLEGADGIGVLFFAVKGMFTSTLFSLKTHVIR